MTWACLAPALALCALAAARAGRAIGPSASSGRSGPWLAAVAGANAAILFAAGLLAPWPVPLRCAVLVVGISALAKTLALSRDLRRPLTFRRGLLYLWLYPGLDPDRAFVRDPVPDRARGARAVVLGALEVAAGVAVVPLAQRAGLLALGAWPDAWVRAVSLVGILDGTFRAAMGGLAVLGFRTEPVFREPWLSSDLADFWGRRWNRFVARTLSAEVYRPLRPRAGRVVAVLATFLASGLVHEATVAVPAGGTHGRFLAFFLAQGAALLLLARVGAPLARRAGAWAVLLLTAPLFFGGAFPEALPL